MQASALRLLGLRGSRSRCLLRARRGLPQTVAASANASTAADPPAEGKPEKPAKEKGEKGKQPGKQRKGAAPESTSSAEDIRAIRIQKIADLRAAGKNPFAYRFDRTHMAAQLQAMYEGLAPGEEKEVKEAVAGRVMARRVFGKLAFLSLQDESGSIQLYCDVGKMGEEGFESVKGQLDVGDIVGATGTVKRTEKGELSIVVNDVTLLTKSLLPLPDKFHGLTDIEKRYRQRYVDMLTRPEVRDVFRSRSRIISTMRRQLEDRGFLEIETPVLQSEAGGADARPFATYHNSLERQLTLRIATELHLKRLLVGGFERVFELGRVFRNEGISTRHNPEFTSVEIYQSYADRSDMIELTEELICSAAMASRSNLQFEYQGVPIDMTRPWKRASMNDLVKEAVGVDILSLRADLEGAKTAAEEALRAAEDKTVRASIPNIRTSTTIGHLLNAMFEAAVEKNLMQPTFVLDHPLEISPLAKPHRSIPGVAERFELFIYGREMANAFSELTDPVDQRQRLEAQITNHAAMQAATSARASADASEAAKEAAEEVAYDIKMDEDFVTALEYGMPPAGGLGIGIDRLVMLLTDSASIRDVIAFPLLKQS